MAKYDYDLIVIGGGAAGLTASTGAGQLGAKTLLIEKEKELGGDCLHFGCVPSKSLIKSAYCYNVLKNSPRYGLPEVQVPPVEFSKIKERLQDIIATIQQHDSPEYIQSHYHVETRFGEPQFTSNHSIVINGATITAKHFILATGSSPTVPPIEGLDKISFLTNKSIFFINKVPSSLIVLGGGPIGMEMAQAFARLGSQVTVIEFFEQLLPREDTDIGEFIETRMEKEGLKILVNSLAKKVEQTGDRIKVTFEDKKTKAVQTVDAEQILVATGRQANVEGLNLESAGIAYTKRGIRVDSRLRTTTKNTYACGDVNGQYPFTHVAGHEGSLAMANAIMRLPVQVDYTNMPWCTYLDPEIASVGYNEKRAQEAGVAYTVQKEEFKNNDRALAEGEADGFIKILINKKGKAIGVQIVGYHAGDLIHEWVAALNGKISLATIAHAVHAYPTLSEISKGASGNFLAPKLFNHTVRKALKILFGLQGNI